jgi:hypothetical protein
LTRSGATAIGLFMQNNLFAAASVAALLSLAACKNQPEMVDTNPDPMKDELAKAAPVEVPLMIQSSRTYRCKDNSLVYIDFMNDQKTANFRAEKGVPPTVLKAEEVGQPLKAEGYSVSGSGQTVTLERPGKGSQTCKA